LLRSSEICYFFRDLGLSAESCLSIIVKGDTGSRSSLCFFEVERPDIDFKGDEEEFWNSTAGAFKGDVGLKSSSSFSDIYSST